MTKLKPSTRLANKRPFVRHSKAIWNRIDTKLKLGNLTAETRKDSAHYHWAIAFPKELLSLPENCTVALPLFPEFIFPPTWVPQLSLLCVCSCHLCTWAWLIWGREVPIPGPYFWPPVLLNYWAHCLHRKVHTNSGPCVLWVPSPSCALIARRLGYQDCSFSWCIVLISG
jgi:hypothetical protein